MPHLTQNLREIRCRLLHDSFLHSEFGKESSRELLSNAILNITKSVYGLIGPFTNYTLEYKVSESMRHQEFEHILRVIEYDVR